MAIHNSAGVKILEKLQFERVILARELSLSEIKKIKQKTKLELELFVHGALCYGISGLCLASSYLGGASGNRGRCTQVCRRRFTSAKDSGFYFSPRDFSALDHFENLVELGINSLKIEGRMKSTEYVHHVVTNYRKLLDGRQNVEETRIALAEDLGRPKTDFFLSGQADKNILSPKSSGGTGKQLGTVKKVDDKEILISGIFTLLPGDRLRFQGKKGDEGTASPIKEIEIIDGNSQISLRDPVAKIGDEVFLISRKQAQVFEKKVNINGKAGRFRKLHPKAKAISTKAFQRAEGNSKKRQFFFRVSDVEWLSILQKENHSGIFLSLSGEETDHFLAKPPKKLNNVIFTLPPVIYEDQLENWQERIHQLKKVGIHELACSNPGHFNLVGKQFKLTADWPLWTLNGWTIRNLKKLQVEQFILSPEDDIINLKKLGGWPAIAILFCRVPLFLSRIPTEHNRNASIVDSRGEVFFSDAKDGIQYLYGDRPFSIFHRRKKLEEAGINRFLIDLSTFSPNRHFLKSLISAWQNCEKIPDTQQFNLKRGLK
jgi:putative protease